ncbi:hypothetical protein T4B_11762 [Trichinella pseudospiralis]|uniref:Uncharacterized protein n=1 Tax=Trichinella pseudospiralis TaxID=6337 RepID=A0A0V1IWN4_TRIPS|nr:hypothetical protein T4B_11762 [Trichinella pseudospiralis]
MEGVLTVVRLIKNGATTFCNCRRSMHGLSNNEINEIRYHSNSCSVFSSFNILLQAKRNGKRPYMQQQCIAISSWLVSYYSLVSLRSKTEYPNGLNSNCSSKPQANLKCWRPQNCGASGPKRLIDK